MRVEGPAGSYPVSWLEQLPYPVRNTLRQWRGMSGMILGVGIALGISMTLVAVARASMDYYTADFRRSGADLFVITQGGTLVPVLPSDTPGTIKHAAGTLAQIRGAEGVASAIGFMTWSMVRDREGPKRPDAPAELVTVVGIDGDVTMFPGMLVLTEGRWIRRSNEIILGSKLSREKQLVLGDTIRLAGRSFVIAGIGKIRGLGAAVSGDSIAYMDYRAFRQRAEIGDVVGTVVVRASNLEAARQRIMDIGDLAVSTTTDLIAKAEEVNAAAVVIRGIIVVLTLSVAALFVNSMLSHSVAERRAEFATLRAIGVPSSTILFMVGSEATLISAGAGLVGFVLSLMLGWMLNAYVAAAYSIDYLYVVDAPLFIGVFALALVLGFGSGLLPARRATQVDPVEVLREV